MYKSYNIKNDLKNEKIEMKWNDPQCIPKRGAGYYKHQHYHYPYIVGTMVSPLINIANLKETWIKTTTKCVNKTQYISVIG
jgi:hypothetical protein